MTAESNSAQPHLNKNDADKDAPKDSDQSVEAQAAAKRAEAGESAEANDTSQPEDSKDEPRKGEQAGTYDEDELVDEWGEESMPASDPPGNY